MTRARFPAFPPRPRKAFHRADNITSINCLPLGEFHTCYQLPRRGGRDYGGHRKEPDAHALFSGYDPTTPHSGARDLHSENDYLHTHSDGTEVEEEEEWLRSLWCLYAVIVVYWLSQSLELCAVGDLRARLLVYRAPRSFRYPHQDVRRSHLSLSHLSPPLSHTSYCQANHHLICVFSCRVLRLLRWSLSNIFI